jgi:hypothetical protein
MTPVSRNPGSSRCPWFNLKIRVACACRVGPLPSPRRGAASLLKSRHVRVYDGLPHREPWAGQPGRTRSGWASSVTRRHGPRRGHGPGRPLRHRAAGPPAQPAAEPSWIENTAAEWQHPNHCPRWWVHHGAGTCLDGDVMPMHYAWMLCQYIMHGCYANACPLLNSMEVDQVNRF